MAQSEFYKYLMDYSYNHSAEVLNTCGCEDGCTHPRGTCPSSRGNSKCWSNCFNEIYQPENHTNGRLKYNCPKLVNQYVYRALDKQASEILYALENFCKNKLNHYESFEILSLGCGPATELIAIEHFNKINLLNKSINYYGIDVETTWNVIHKKIQEYIENDIYINSVHSRYDDVINVLNSDVLSNKKFNLILLNYLISSLIADRNDVKINEIFNNITRLIIKNQISDCIVIINDVNLDIRGRDTFINLLEAFQSNGVNIFAYKQKCFLNNRWNNGGELYGERYSNNQTIFKTHYEKTAFPNNTCTSAQLLINAGAY